MVLCRHSQALRLQRFYTLYQVKPRCHLYPFSYLLRYHRRAYLQKLPCFPTQLSIAYLFGISDCLLQCGAQQCKFRLKAIPLISLVCHRRSPLSKMSKMLALHASKLYVIMLALKFHTAIGEAYGCVHLLRNFTPRRLPLFGCGILSYSRHRQQSYFVAQVHFP